MKNKFNTNSAVDKKERRRVLEGEGKCGRCPLHGGENERRRPRDDKYKNKR
jgi:hypothetical protein